jgi:hypothetical protein
MVSDQLVELLRGLSNGSRASKVGWRGTGAPTMFDAPMKSAILRIEQIASDAFEAPTYRMSLFNANGDLLEQVTDEDFSSKMSGSYEALADLYATARAKALGVGNLVTSLLSEIDES